jgi:CspA family cold shock protein
MDLVMIGKVSWFNTTKGYGFIKADGQDWFLHFKQIQMDGYKTLNAGEQVTFEAEQGPRGPVAKNVVPLL